LAQHFLILHREKVSKKVEGFTGAALQKLQSYDYPGNIRELENKIHHALVLVTGDVIEPEHIPMPEGLGRKAVDIDLDTSFRDLKREVVESFERAYTIKLLELHKGNLAAASRQAGIDRKNLWAMARRYGIEVKNIRARTRGGSEGG